MDKKECLWTHEDNPDDYNCWETSCGEIFCLTDGEPEYNLYHFCPNCGGKLVEKSK